MEQPQPYVLYYYPIPARGEFIQLILEVVGHPYKEVREIPDIMAAKSGLSGNVHFAHPILQISESFSLSQTPVICAYLAQKHGLMPEGEGHDFIAMQIDHTIHDMLVEVQATHHPIEHHGLEMKQRKRRARNLKSRLPTQLRHLESSALALSRGDDPFLFGKKLSYVDLSIAFFLDGLEYSFPKFFGKMKTDIPRLLKLRNAVLALERVKSYRGSARRQPFSDGIFRYVPELDEE